MKALRSVTVILSLLYLVAFSPAADGRDVLYQVSTIDALLQGLYDGELTVAELKEHGHFGLGTFQALDGEMVALDGGFYQIRSDGSCHAVDDTIRTPFAAVTFFEPDLRLSVDEGMDYSQLEALLTDALPTDNIFYAVKITGSFAYLKARSVPRQQKPYPLLMDVVQSQPTFEFENARGTLVGFRCPAYVKGINVPGYHFHFIDEKRISGGHVLECRVGRATIEIDPTSEFHVVLPESSDFFKLDLAQDQQKQLQQVEK